MWTVCIAWPTIVVEICASTSIYKEINCFVYIHKVWIRISDHIVFWRILLIQEVVRWTWYRPKAVIMKIHESKLSNVFREAMPLNILSLGCCATAEWSFLADTVYF